MAPEIFAEEWRPVEGFPGYEVSSYGRVRSVDRVVVQRNGKRRQYISHILRPGLDAGGYLRAGLGRIDGRSIFRLIHVLVCEAFHGRKPSSKHIVAHNDNNRQNNHKGNVRWATRKENSADQLAHGTATIGSRNGVSILTDEEVIEIRATLKENPRRGIVTELAIKYGMSHPAISHIKTGKTWKHLMHTPAEQETQSSAAKNVPKRQKKTR